MIILDTYLVYFDETGDDGITTASSDVFVLTSMYIKHHLRSIRFFSGSRLLYHQLIIMSIGLI